MPFWVGDYLADTMHLTTVQHGAYIMLILAYWRKGGPLRNNDDGLAAITKLTRNEWRKHKNTLLAYFELIDGEFHHHRIDKELAKAREKSAKAKESADARWGANGMQNGCDLNANAYANASPKHVPPQCYSESVLNTKSKNHAKPKVFTKGIEEKRKQFQADIEALAAKGIQ
jgi:uncharacterized protein YdaU (DUF1376 family)